MKKMNRLLSVMLVFVMLIGASCTGNVSDDTYGSDQVGDSQGTNPDGSGGSDESGGQGNEDADTKDKDTDSMSSEEASILIKGLGTSVEVKLSDIVKLTSVTRQVKSLSSDGEEANDEVQGFLLTEVLSSIGQSMDGVKTIRFTAGDGYAITVPSDIVESKEILLANVWNGQDLIQREQPLRVAIDDVRSMYFVSNLVEIELKDGDETGDDESGSDMEVTNELILMETAITTLPSEEYLYYDSPDQAVKVADLIEAFDLPLVDEVAFVASDGYAKTEEFEVVQDCYIKFTGDEAPLFTSHDLPYGMIIKYVMTMGFDHKVLVSLDSALDTMEVSEIGGFSGVNAFDLIKSGGLETDYYLLVASDGYSIQVSKATLSSGVAYIDDKGSVSVTFASDNLDKSVLKSLLSVSSGDGSSLKTFQVSDDKQADSDGETLGWTIVFDGLDDGAFDMTSDRAERKLERVELHTERMKDDIIYPEDWEGYRLNDILSFLRVESYESLILIAEDGYEIVLTSDQVDDETIFAVMKNGDAISGGNPVQLVQNTEFATTWIRNVVKVIVQ